MLILRTEDYIANTSAALAAVMTHLEMDFTPEQLTAMAAQPVQRGSRPHDSTPGRGEMGAEAAALLRAFFKPYNRRLADALGRERFTWSREIEAEGGGAGGRRALA